MIKWNEIDSLVGKPVYDKGNDMWRVIIGYQRIGDEHYIAFTDYDEFEDIDVQSTNLYKSDKIARGEKNEQFTNYRT